MAIRQMTGNRSLHSASISNRKVAPAAIDVPIHSYSNENEKGNQLNNYKQEKLAAGIRAADTHNYREAIKQFTLIKPDTITSLYLAGCARLELKHYIQAEEALVDFNKCLELLHRSEPPPFGLELWYKRALAYHNVGKYDEAIEDFTEYISRSRSLTEQEKSNLHRGLIARGQTYQATYELDAAMEDTNEANELTSERNPYYLCCRASIYASKDDIKTALKDLEKASDAGCYQDAEALFQRGIVLANLNRHNAALEDLKKALTLSSKPSEQSDICFHCGLSEYALNNKEQAYQWFSRALSLHPYHAQAYFRLGMMLSEKGQYKEALKNLNRAHDLSPEQSDILLERANIHEKLGEFNDAVSDRKRANKIDSTDMGIIKTLGNRVKTLREEIDRTDASPRTHLELAIAYDGLLTRKKNLTTRVGYYQKAIREYYAVIETDTKNLYPQTRALTMLCHQKMSDITEAHRLHMELYDLLSKNKEATYHWKAYILDVQEKMESGRIEPHLDQSSISRLIRMEFNRRKQSIDEETLRKDTQDHYKNQLVFYEKLRLELANLLAAISVLNLDHDFIVYNVDNQSKKINKIIQVFIEGETSIYNIESILNSDTKSDMDVFRSANYDMVKMKLRSLGNVGDLTDHVDIAQLVARHLCTRYHSQFLCLQPNADDIVDDESPVKMPSRSSWCCCSGDDDDDNDDNRVSVGNSTIVFEKDILRKLATFAIAFVIAMLNTEQIKVSPNEKSQKKDAVATMLILTISRADPSIDTNLFSSSNYENANMALDSTALAKTLNHSQNLADGENTLPIKWNRYEFFRTPGIYYQTDGETGKVHYYGSDPRMRPDTYGYRLGTKEEVQVFQKTKAKNK